MYADGIILMSTTLNGLQKLVDKCIEISKNTVSALTRTKPNPVYQKGVNINKTNNYITKNGYTIRPKDNLKNLVFF